MEVSERCIVCHHNSEVEVSKTQLEAISKALKSEIVQISEESIVNSPFPLREICLEDYEVANSTIKTIK